MGSMWCFVIIGDVNFHYLVKMVYAVFLHCKVNKHFVLLLIFRRDDLILCKTLFLIQLSLISFSIYSRFFPALIIIISDLARGNFVWLLCPFDKSILFFGYHLTSCHKTFQAHPRVHFCKEHWCLAVENGN